jgi:hypothetical protein
MKMMELFRRAGYSTFNGRARSHIYVLRDLGLISGCPGKDSLVFSMLHSGGNTKAPASNKKVPSFVLSHPTTKLIMDRIRNGESVSVRTVANITACSKHAARQHIKSLLDHGILTVSGSVRGTKYSIK